MELLNKYPTNFCRDAISHWSNVDAVREFVQNMHDSDGESYWKLGEDSIVLGNSNIKVSVSALLTGKSDKRGDESKIGKFGTGSLFAMTVLASNGATVYIRNAGKIWIPEYEYSDQYKEDVLVINEYNDTKVFSNYEVSITGLHEQDVFETKERTLAFQDRKVLASTEIGDILEETGDGYGGEIFVGGLFVTQDTSIKYNYNFKPEFLKLNQDRDMLDSFQLSILCAKLWAKVTDKELLKTAIKSDARDCEYVSDSYWSECEKLDITEDLAEEFFEEKGECLVTNNHDKYVEQKNLGNDVSYVSNTALYQSIMKSDKYQKVKDSLIVVDKKTPQQITCELIDNVLALLWEHDIIPTDNVGEQHEGDMTTIKHSLYKLKEESYKWRN